MKRILLSLLLLISVFSIPALVHAQSNKDATRDATREKLRQLLQSVDQRADVNATLEPSAKEPYVFSGWMRNGFSNVESLEIVISVTKDDTIGFRVYPHYNNSYINIDKVRNSSGLMRKLLNMSDHNFLYWGADETGDIFSGYTFTLESGFPSEAITIVMRSIRNTDGFVGEMRPFIDGSYAPAK
ncbi:MAG: hypothetical protein ABR555_06860 [Pyrinomonadaceae bacterium]